MFVSQMAPKSILRKRYLKVRAAKKVFEIAKKVFEKGFRKHEEGLRKQGQINIRPKLKV